MQSKNWLFSKGTDLLVLFLPVWATWVACFLLPSSTLQREVPVWIWVVFILGIDVSHVWSTLFRTYLDKDEFKRHQYILTYTPILCFFAVFVVVSYSTGLFWRLLAYFALFHFIKQQYGFLVLYKARAGHFRIKKFFRDKWVIYFSMIYPVIFWHLKSDRNFSWFETGDFINFKTILLQVPGFSMQMLDQGLAVANIIYWLVMLAWLLEEVWLYYNKQIRFSSGKVFWMFTTAVNWYLGIVYFNSDLAFSLTNVVAHGVPYMTLIFYYVHRKKALSPVYSLDKKPFLPGGGLYGSLVFQGIFMLGIVFILAFGEEYLWDMLLFREKAGFFESILQYPMNMLENPYLQAFAFAMLSIPQVTHYVLDGYIWKGDESNPYVKLIFLR